MRILVRDLSPGTAYNFQFRANDGHDVSNWSPVLNLTTTGDILAPKTPTGTTWTIQGTSFLATWSAVTQNSDNSTLSDFSHYLVQLEANSTVVQYKTTSTRFDFTLEMNAAAFGSPKAAVKFSVAAVDSTGNSSAFSTEITQTNPAPAAPTGFTANGIQDGIVLNWNSVADTDLKLYRIHMETSGSGFTPGSGNIVFEGRATSYTHSSNAYGVTHYFKLAAVDVFDTPSTFVAASSTPTSSFDVDADPPDVPTGLTVTPSTNALDASRVDFTVSWTAVVAGDLQGYKVRYRPGTSGPYQFIEVPSDAVSTIVYGLETGVTYQFQVLAYDFVANESAWSSVVNGTQSNTAPSKPSQPSLVGSIQSFAISHDLTKAAGGALESDIVALKVFIGDTSTFGTASPVLIETISVAAGSTIAVSGRIPVSLAAGSPTKYIYVKAVDRLGLESTNSDAVAITISAISGTYIEDATITTAKIQSLEANKITAGSGIINNLLIKSALNVDIGGVIQSKAYVDSSGTTGFFLDDDSLIIKSGNIAAAALEVQSGNNIIPIQYSGFEFTPSYYKVRADTGAADAAATLSVDGSTISTIALTIDSTRQKYEVQSLKVANTGGAQRFFYFGNGNADNNIQVEESKQYIVSAWVYVEGATSKTITLRLRGNNSYTQSTAPSVPAVTWTRISFVATIPVGTNIAQVSFVIPATTTISVDGVQVEEKIGALTTPSTWKPPGVTKIDGGAIRTGEIRSTTETTVNGVQQPNWSINIQGNAQFGNASVRGQILVGLASGATDLDNAASKIQSGNYLASTRGWIIRSDGYAEFRNLAVNSIRITALDSPLQNSLATKLYDYMEDPALWNILSGSVVGTTNDTGAFTSDTVLSMTGDSSVLRNTAGVSGGIAFEPEVLYRISARVRQLTGDEDIGSIYKARIGFFGYTENGTLCGYDGTTSVSSQYFFVANDDDLSIFDGSSGQSAGWTNFVGYLRGKQDTGASGKHSDIYNPGYVHENVRYIIPYVRLNIGNSTHIAQLDAFTVETFESGAPLKIATDFTGRKAISIENIPDETFDHAIRFYSGEAAELNPGIIGHYLDQTNSDASAIVISPPLEAKPQEDYQFGSISVVSRTTNYIKDASFENGIEYWTDVTLSTLTHEISSTTPFGREDDGAAKLVPTGAFTSTSQIAAFYDMNVQDSPELLGMDRITFSAYVMPTNRTMNVYLDISVLATTGGEIISVESSPTSCPANEWTRVSMSYQYVATLPDDTETLTATILYRTGVVSGDILYIDDVQLEFGTTLTDYKAANSSKLVADTDVTVLNGGIFITANGDVNIPKADGYLTMPLVKAREDAPANPMILLGHSASNLLIGNFNYTDASDNFRHFSEFGHLGATVGRSSGFMRFYDDSDQLTPGRWEIRNKLNQQVLYTQNKFNDFEDSVTTQDIRVAGWAKVDGTPPWKAISVAGWNWGTQAGGYLPAYYVNEGRVFLRGLLVNSGSLSKSPGSSIVNIPTEARPDSNVFLNANVFLYPSTVDPVLLEVSSVDGNLRFNAVAGGTVNGNVISLEGLSYSITPDLTYTAPSTDGVAPNAPTSLTIRPYSSSRTTGIYTLRWTASTSSDVATSRIVWRSDRYAANPNDGKVIDVPSTASAVKSYNVGGLPINKVIYVKVYARDKSGNYSSSAAQAGRYLLASPIFIDPTSTRSWRDSFGGQWRTDTDDVYQGEYSGFNDNHRGVWFYSTQINDQLTRGSVNRTATKVTIYLKRRNTSHGVAGEEQINLTSHGYASQPGSIPVIGFTQTNFTQLRRGEYGHFTIPSSWYTNISNGAIKGFGIHDTGANYAVLDGKSINSVTGRLQVWHKG